VFSLDRFALLSITLLLAAFPCLPLLLWVKSIQFTIAVDRFLKPKVLETSSDDPETTATSTYVVLAW